MAPSSASQRHLCTHTYASALTLNRDIASGTRRTHALLRIPHAHDLVDSNGRKPLAIAVPRDVVHALLGRHTDVARLERGERRCLPRYILVRFVHGPQPWTGSHAHEYPSLRTLCVEAGKAAWAALGARRRLSCYCASSRSCSPGVCHGGRSC